MNPSYPLFLFFGGPALAPERFSPDTTPAICQTTGVMNALRKILIVQILLAGDSTLFSARANSSADEVTCRTNATLVRSTGDWKPLESELKMPGDIRVFTNCTFQINERKRRTLQEGQILRSDGNLLNPD